jgi:hypothetical protein
LAVDNEFMLALSIRQPYAELILRGIKRMEFRSRATKVIGERFWIYASKNKGQVLRGKGQEEEKTLTLPSPRGRGLRADNIEVAGEVPEWMVELANALRMFRHELPTGVIVGSAVIEAVSQREDGIYQWHLTDVERATTLRKPKRHPQPVWFRPF